ncbi:MAG TPA: hypothetical protein PKJ47_03745 [Candidatus Limiplasma sp.]|nr:hypothetical protein [Candidatus Limiplasma sp.]
MPNKLFFRIPTHNRTKVLLCYLLAWGVALLLPYLGLTRLYPYKLAGSAPEVSQSVLSLPLALPGTVKELLTAAQFSSDMSPAALSVAIAARDRLWRYAVAGVMALAALLSLLWQLLWRVRYRRPKQAARAAMRAVMDYHLSMAGIIALNALMALALYLLGVRWIGGRTVWDYLVYFSGFVLNPLAAMVCFRLAAPPAISGKHGFFRRL